MAWNFSLSPQRQSGRGDHLASYSIDVFFFSRVELLGLEADYPSPPFAEVMTAFMAYT
jgi:hypothetical protein